MRGVATAFALAAVLAVAVPGLAQEVNITAPAPERAREPFVVPPGDHYDATRPSDADYYMPGPKVRDDPAFIGPLSSKSADGTGRSGVGGWTAPNTPVIHSESSGYRDNNGWFALGFAFEWGGPPPRRAPARPPTP